LNNYQVWFITGSQHLYGEETLKQVAEDSAEIAGTFDREGNFPVQIVDKGTLKTPDEILSVCQQANVDNKCVGLIAWMHTFSPAKMWIAGLTTLNKPFVHLHTQFNRDIPWDSIDMDFMNLNQSAHGGREFGFIGSRMNIDRKVIVGHYKEKRVMDELDTWFRAALAWHDSRSMKIARFGDNMREVAVTEGDKVEAQMKFGYSVYGYGVGDLVKCVKEVSESEVKQLVETYREQYKTDQKIFNEKIDSVVEAARIEAGMKNFLESGGFKAFTTTFEDLHGLKQLPGIAVQRLMEAGYGFGAEGDWKTAALVRSMKVMGVGLQGGTSFMEDYTYHLHPDGNRVLGAHMLEVCPSIADAKPSLELHQLGIGGKEDPVRLVFKCAPGSALNATVLDLGNRFRMIVNTVEVTDVPDLPRLPVARVLWDPKPNLEVAAGAWILGGGAHHTGFSQVVTKDHLEIFAGMAGIEFLLIDEKTSISDFKKELRWNDVYYKLM